MRLFHRHQWEEHKRSYTASNGGHVRGADDDTVLALAFGITVVEMRCSVCGDLKHHIVPGRGMPS